MGISILGRNSSDRYLGCCQTPSDLPNPDPANYKINHHRQLGRMLLVDINYPDCTNYEGRKILVYDGVTIEQLRKQKLIDPHFSENEKYTSPVARFEPTDRGWKMAGIFARAWMYDEGI